MAGFSVLKNHATNRYRKYLIIIVFYARECRAGDVFTKKIFLFYEHGALACCKEEHWSDGSHDASTPSRLADPQRLSEDVNGKRPFPQGGGAVFAGGPP
jgi:hypothetical protein